MIKFDFYCPWVYSYVRGSSSLRCLCFNTNLCFFQPNQAFIFLLHWLWGMLPPTPKRHIWIHHQAGNSGLCNDTKTHHLFKHLDLQRTNKANKTKSQIGISANRFFPPEPPHWHLWWQHCCQGACTAHSRSPAASWHSCWAEAAWPESWWAWPDGRGLNGLHVSKCFAEPWSWS